MKTSERIAQLKKQNSDDTERYYDHAWTKVEEIAIKVIDVLKRNEINFQLIPKSDYKYNPQTKIEIELDDEPKRYSKGEIIIGKSSEFVRISYHTCYRNSNWKGINEVSPKVTYAEKPEDLISIINWDLDAYIVNESKHSWSH